jgi:hypothetical protein
MRHLVAVIVIAAIVSMSCLLAPAAFARSAVTCELPGAWPHTADAAWLVRALTRAGFDSFGCTGSAFVVDLGGDAFTGQIYVWSTRGVFAKQPRSRIRVAGVVVHRDGVRGVWRARGRNVWVQAAGSSMHLVPVRRWATIIRATLATR